MARKRQINTDANIADYRHEGTKRKNIPPAKLAAEGTVPVLPKIEYGYSPRRPPVLRFDSSGDTDKLPELLAAAKKRKLTDDEIGILAEALRTQEPWLEWAGKREMPSFAVDPVALHIHERVSAQAILKIAARQDVERSLFGDPEQAYNDAIQFYRHDIDWTNRLILGDSLQVMASLAKREDLAGKVQMIFIDPPYGIKFRSNFQPEIGNKTVGDAEKDLTREPETVKAYRDVWHLGLHSYLTYLRDRILLAREMLTPTGSVFVQISDENLHHVREVMDEVFGPENFVCLITFRKTGGEGGTFLGTTCDFLLWYAKDRTKAKYRQLYLMKQPGDEGAAEYTNVELADGSFRPMTDAEVADPATLPDGSRVFATWPIVSPGFSEINSKPIRIGDNNNSLTFRCPSNRHWSVGVAGTIKLWNCDRLLPREGQRIYKRYLNDFRCTPINNQWMDCRGEIKAVYVVQTSSVIVQRCMLMTTDPGDLVLDPTCGSGTTANVAEQWGRRWITIDTSRVAVAIARQRLLTAKFDYYQLRNEKAGVAGGFAYESVPYISFGSIARNTGLGPILAKHEPILDAKLKACNAALAKVPAELRTRIGMKLAHKEQKEGKRAVTDADRRRWNLPEKGKTWEHWTVPFDTDPDYPAELQKAVTEYRAAWRAKMDEVNTCIAQNAEQEELVDQPLLDKTVKLRVSGPFSVEAVQPPELNMGDVIGEFDGASGEVEGHFVMREVSQTNEFEVKNVDAYLDQMTKLLRLDGVRFPNNKEMAFSRLLRLADSSGIHAEGRWVSKGEADPDADGDANVGIVFGPQYGPFTVQMLEKLIKPAQRRYDALVIAAFNFTAEVQDLADNPQVKDFRIHVAHIRPDVNPGMAGLLKEQPGSQLFTVFGQPRTKVDKVKGKDEYVVTMEGVDIYDPVNNVIRSTEDSKVAAWFLDGDYDGRTFCVTQAFFPDKSAWEKLSKALGGVVDPERFEALTGTTSLPFPAGKHKCVAVKVIDPRGNEVMQVHKLGDLS